MRKKDLWTLVFYCKLQPAWLLSTENYRCRLDSKVNPFLKTVIPGVYSHFSGYYNDISIDSLLPLPEKPNDSKVPRYSSTKSVTSVCPFFNTEICTRNPVLHSVLVVICFREARATDLGVSVLCPRIHKGDSTQDAEEQPAKIIHASI